MSDARRFATPAMVAVLVAYSLAVLSWFQPRVSNDGVSYFSFLQHLLGDSADGYAYQFGAALWNLPLYLVARLVQAAGLDEVSGLPLDELAFTLGSVVACGLLFPVGWVLLRDAGLNAAPLAVSLAVVGSPLAYSVLFSPYDAHAVDALGATVLAVLLLRATRRETVGTGLAVALGATLGYLVTVRYANLVLALGVATVLLVRRERSAATVAGVTAVAIGGALLALPLMRGIPYGSSATPELNTSATISDEISIDPFVPLKMLFTLERGLFVWTPLTLVALVGVALIWRRAPDLRLFLKGLGINAAALLAFHVVWGKYWTGGFGFSQRFLIGLFPLFVLGTAELFRRYRLAALAVLLPCAAWTSFLALYHFYGYEGISAEDGADRVVELYVDGEETPEEFIRVKLADPVVERWRDYIDAVRGS